MCPNCDCWFQWPQPPKIFEGAHEQNERGETIGHLMSDHEKGVNAALASSIFHNFMGGKPGKMLDIGAKFPILSHYFKHLGCEAYAMDNLEIVPEYSKELGVPMLMADFEALTEQQITDWIHGGKFAVITLVHCFEHLYKPLEALKKLRSLISDDGILFLRLPDHGVPGFERDLTAGHQSIHPFFHSLPSILELLVQGQDLFEVFWTSQMDGAGQRDIILHPLKKAPQVWCGMIVKNEERDLPKCLESIKNVVDGIVLIDTGSVDKTIDVAKATITDKPLEVQTYLGASKQDDAGDWKLWDFSKARNVFVDRIDQISDATHLVWMDADDTLLTPNNFRRAAYLSGFDVFGMMIETCGMQWVHHRMWKTRKGIRFAGRIHEYPDFGNRAGISLPDVVIRHDAEPGIGENSNARNLRILEAEYAENPTPRTAFYLANTHKDAGRWREAIDYYKVRIQMGEHYRDEWLFSYLYLARCQRAGELISEAQATLYEALSKAPNWGEFWMELAFIDYLAGKWQTAIGFSMKALGCTQEPTQLWRERNMYTDQPLRLLSFCTEQLGDKKAALDWALKAKEVIGEHDESWNDRIKSLQPAPVEESKVLAERFMRRKGKAVQSKPKIALNRPGAIGDVIMTLNLIPVLRQAYPNHQIDYFSAMSAHLKELMHEAGVTECFMHTDLHWKASEYERVINLVGYPLSEGYPDVPMKKHLIEYFADEMGLKLPGMPRMVLARKPLPLGLPLRYATAHVQAGWSPYKSWPMERWEAVIAENPDIPVYQIGSASDYKLKGADHSYMGRELSESIVLMSHATIHMGVDSWTNHLTNIKWRNKGQTPAVILWGSTQWEAAGYPHNINISLGLPCQPCFKEDPKISAMPRGVCENPPGQTYENPCHACMAGISVERVSQAVRNLWETK